MRQKMPRYIFEKGNIVRLIIFTAVFALIFINIYKPFSSESWYDVSNLKFFVYSSLIILTGVLVVVISRIVMYYWGLKRDLSIAEYALWILLEILFMSLFYTIYTVVLNPGRDFMDAFGESALNTSLVLLLPYFALHLYLAYVNKDKQLKTLEEGLSGKETTQDVYSFYDEKGELRLSVKSANLLYAEAADNYVTIWYLNKGKLTKYMLRNTLKSLEKKFSGTSLLRCHRSYMVNFDQVKVLRRQNDGIYMELGTDNVPDIPISKSYSEKVTRWFSSCP